jgi:type II secretory pathway component PulK
MRSLSAIGERGTALVLTLLIIVTLTGLTVAFSEDAGIELELASFSRDHFRTYQLGRAGIHIALSMLDKDEDRALDSLREDWAQFGEDALPESLPEGVSISGRIIDEESKFNINLLVSARGEEGLDPVRETQLLRLFEVLGLGKELADGLLDWLDQDDVQRMNGAEDYYYQSLRDPYPCSNGPFITIGQVLLVKGMRRADRDIQGDRGLLPSLTIHSDGTININTASEAVLQSLDEEIDGILAKSIAEYRLEEDFTRIEDLKKVSGIDEDLFSRIKDRIGVKSTAFTIEMSVSHDDTTARITALVKRDGKGLHLAAWQVI